MTVRYSKINKYDDYRNIQIDRSNKKWASATFDEKMFYKILLTALPNMIVKSTGHNLGIKNICCMGIRNGNEYSAIKKIRIVLDEFLYLNEIQKIEKANVYGVDINPKVVNVGENCYCYDFNKLPEEWEDKFDLIYSNSVDHSFNVSMTINEWHRVSMHNRFLLLTLSNEKISATDIYSFEKKDIKNLFNESMFEIIKIWKEYEQKKSFNVLIRVKKYETIK